MTPAGMAFAGAALPAVSVLLGYLFGVNLSSFHRKPLFYTMIIAALGLGGVVLAALGFALMLRTAGLI